MGCAAPPAEVEFLRAAFACEMGWAGGTDYPGQAVGILGSSENQLLEETCRLGGYRRRRILKEPQAATPVQRFGGGQMSSSTLGAPARPPEALQSC